MFALKGRVRQHREVFFYLEYSLMVQSYILQEIFGSDLFF